MSTERDKLAEILKAERWKYVPLLDEDGNPDGGMFEQTNEEVADAVLAAGYRKPRTVTTVEELDALPAGSVILVGRNSLQKDGAGYWYFWGGDVGLEPGELEMPATVLHEGNADV